MSPRQKIDMKQAIRRAKVLIKDVKSANANEAETRTRIERGVFEDILGYDGFQEISREHRVRGAGTDHIDFIVKLDGQVRLIVEIKAVGKPLKENYLKQAVHYGMDAGIEWCLLTNGINWELYHLEFTKPISHTLIMNFNLLEDDVKTLMPKMQHLTRSSLKRGGLNKLWEKKRTLTMKNMLKVILSPTHIRSIRSHLRKQTGILVAAEDVVIAFRQMLNENARTAFNKMDLVFREKKSRRSKPSVSEEKSAKETDLQSSNQKTDG